MNVFALLAAGGSGQSSFSRTFTANATWTAPATTSQIDSASGKGADGTAASAGTNYLMYRYQYRVHNYANGGTSVGPARLLQIDPCAPNAPVPGGYCDPLVSGSDGSPGITGSDGTYYPVTSYQDCYYYEYHENPYNNPATTGQNTTAFGLTFPGGSGGPATTTTFSNIAITPNASYSIVVPSGGTLTITWRA